MSKKQNILTIADLKTFLYSLEIAKEQEIDEQINDYKMQCEENEKEPKDKYIQKIRTTADKKYKKTLDVRDRIFESLEEVSVIPKQLDKVKVISYMIERTKNKKALGLLTKTNTRITRRYNTFIEKIEQDIKFFDEFSNVEEINFSIFNTSGEIVKQAKDKYKFTYSDEEKLQFIQKELDIVNESTKFNMLPVPHEILKDCDKSIQTNMKKFNKVREKRLRILSVMPDYYKQLIEPRYQMNLIDEAIQIIDDSHDVFINSEYSSIKNCLLKNRKKIYKTTSEVRSTIKYKEKKTGIVSYNVQAARYQRMIDLRNVITGASNVIQANTTNGEEEQLEKMKIAYEKEKQYEFVIEKLDNDTSTEHGSKVSVLQEQVANLENKINTSKKIIDEQTDILLTAKKELSILWKIEIDSALSKKIDTLELPEDTTSTENRSKGFFKKINKVTNEKHACV